VANLNLSANSSNPTLVPTSNIVFGGSGSNRTVTVTPVAGQAGSATITLSVSDGQYIVSTGFLLTVSTLSTASFTNAAVITIPDSGPATPYPSTINVSGVSGIISNMTITLRGVSHSWASDMDVLLVGPSGQSVMLMSDAGSGGANNVTLTLSDAASASLPASGLVSGTFRPTNLSDSSAGGDNFPSPAPAGPYGSTLGVFNGQTATGIWSLYAFDDGVGDQGSIAGGWTMTLTTETATAPSAPAALSQFTAAGNPPRITSILYDGGDIRLSVTGEVGFAYALEVSSDLVTWTRLATQDNTSGTLTFHDQPATTPILFYRAVTVLR
jgi:subtilisin-like proprotein convertase family protein